MLQHAKLTFDKTLNTKIYQTPPPELSCNVCTTTYVTKQPHKDQKLT